MKALPPGSKVAAYARYAASNQNAHVNGLRQLNSERATVVRHIFRDYSADIEIRDITEALNAEAVSKLVQP